MKAISICQPWASCIVIGPKRFENRTWTTPYLGRLLIHASKSRKYLGSCSLQEWPEMPPEKELPFGAIVGIATLAAIYHVDQVRGQPFAEGPWCWKLEDVVACEPLEHKGRQGLFYVGPDITSQLKFIEHLETKTE